MLQSKSQGTEGSVTTHSQTSKLRPFPYTTLPPEKGFLGGPGNEMCHDSGFSVPS